MSSWSGYRRAAAWAVMLWVVSVFAGCGKQGGVAQDGSAQLQVTLAPLSTTPQALDFRASQFETQALAAHPSATLLQDSVYIDTLPRFSDYGQYSGSPDLAMATNSTPGQGDFRVSFEYGNPYPSEWPRFAVAQAYALVPFSLSLPDGGTTRTARYSAIASSQVQLMDGVTQTLVPQVGPPGDPRINGLSATSDLSGVGPTPVVSWRVPALGTPTRYQVRLYELFPSATGGTSRALVASFYTTTQTQLRLPPGFLVSGKSYMMQLFAYDVPGANPDVPFMYGPSFHYASAFTSKFQP